MTHISLHLADHEIEHVLRWPPKNCNRITWHAPYRSTNVWAGWISQNCTKVHESRWHLDEVDELRLWSLQWCCDEAAWAVCNRIATHIHLCSTCWEHVLNPLKAQVQLDVHLQRSNEMYFHPNALSVKPGSGRRTVQCSDGDYKMAEKEMIEIKHQRSQMWFSTGLLFFGGQRFSRRSDIWLQGRVGLFV